MSRGNQAFLEFEHVSKIYSGVTALADVSFEAREGEVHALMGENGAGKSTLLKLLSGAESPTEGQINLGGRAYRFRSTQEALRAGVAVIHQELQLVPQLTVAENIFLGHLPNRAGFVDARRLDEEAGALLRWLGESFAPKTPLARLSLGQRQMVEIAKALSREAKVIAFDEPTSSLSAREIEKLFRVIADLRARRCVVLYVTHRMEEVSALCDACTVLRDGRHVRTYGRLDASTPESLVHDMVGRHIAEVYGYAPRPLGPTGLEIRGVLGPGVRAPVSLQVAQGEILGLFGLVGAGRSELLRLVFGAEHRHAGSVHVHGDEVPLRSPRDAIAAGIAYCPEDRKKEGIIPFGSVVENCNLTARRTHAYPGGIIDEAWERRNAGQQIGALNVRASSLAQEMRRLSGGNQQKVLLARWLSLRIRVLLLDEPTRGVDVGAKSEIYRIIFGLAREGIAVVVVSSDLPEVLGVADRIAIMRQGHLAGVLSRDEASPHRVLQQALPKEVAALDR